MRRQPLHLLAFSLPLLLAACGSEPPSEAPSDASPEASADAPRADVLEHSDASTPTDAPSDAPAPSDAARDVVEEEGGSLDASTADAPSDAARDVAPVDIGPPPSLTEESSSQVLRVALRVEGRAHGEPAVTYTEGRGLVRMVATSRVLVDFEACGASGCARVDGAFNVARLPSVPETFGVQRDGTAWTVSANVEASEPYRVMRATGFELVRNYVARISAPASSEHGAVTGIAGATASPMVGEVWLIGAPSVGP